MQTFGKWDGNSTRAVTTVRSHALRVLELAVPVVHSTALKRSVVLPAGHPEDCDRETGGGGNTATCAYREDFSISQKEGRQARGHKQVGGRFAFLFKFTVLSLIYGRIIYCPRTMLVFALITTARDSATWRLLLYDAGLCCTESDTNKNRHRPKT